MAINAGTVWEVRTTGAQDAGGGFADLNPGTSVDYSQQDAPQLSLTDVVTTAGSTTITSATGGFTAAMVGNVCLLKTSGGTIRGWYQITGYTDTNTVTIDRAPSSGTTGNRCYVGGAFKIGGAVDHDFFFSGVSGNVFWIETGSYTAGESIGSGGLYQVHGYASTRGDRPTGDDRPLIDMGANSFLVAAHLYHLRFTGTGTNVLNDTTAGVLIRANLKVTNTSATAGRYAIQNATGVYSHCEMVSTNGTAVSASASGRLHCCFIHDSTTGVYFVTSLATRLLVELAYCAVARCTTGVQHAVAGVGVGAMSMYGCVFYDCTTGFDGGASQYNSIINCILSGCTTGATWSSSGLQFLDYNCWNNTTDVVNASKGANCITTDPLLVDPDNDDYRLSAGSPCLNAGMQLGAIVGL